MGLFSIDTLVVGTDIVLLAMASGNVLHNNTYRVTVPTTYKRLTPRIKATITDTLHAMGHHNVLTIALRVGTKNTGNLIVITLLHETVVATGHGFSDTNNVDADPFRRIGEVSKVVQCH
jgi:hypothetical protein